MRTVAIFLFPDVETLDFCGPLEAFSAANLATGREYFKVLTFAAASPVRSINGLSVNPDFDIASVPQPDILVIPGGSGSRRAAEDATVLAAIERLRAGSEYAFSVCSGARIPAALGWLDDKPFTTHHLVFDDVLRLASSALPCPDKRFVDNGAILTSAGVAAGIDLSLYLIEKIHGRELAESAARYMEYPLLTAGTKERA